MNTTITINDFNFTIMNAEQGKALLYSDKQEEWDLYSDMKSYCDKKSLTKLKKELGIESKRRIKYVITLTDKHINFKCKQNKKIKYSYRIFVNSNWEGAEPYELETGTGTTYHPYGDIIIVLENDPKTKEEKKQEKLNKLQNKINKINN